MIPTDFHVEPANFHNDQADLRSVRETVFVLEQGVPADMEEDEHDAGAWHVIARDQAGRAIGTGRLTRERKIGRMAVLPEWRRRGVGDAMLVALLDQARNLGWNEVSLHAQVDAEAFYAKHGFEPVGGRFDEAGIAHRAMRLALSPMPAPERQLQVRGPSVPAKPVADLREAIDAALALIRAARRELWIYTRDLEPALYGAPPVLEALREFAIAGRGGVVRILLQEPLSLASSSHPLLPVAQRLSSIFQFRTPVDPIDHQYPSAFLANDQDGFLFRVLASRWDGDWSPAQPAHTRQLQEHFGRVWERSRECSELRALGI
jgi:predicted GNAT family N-acyltransferase